METLETWVQVHVAGDTWKFKVPGGWLYRFVNFRDESTMAFVPDTTSQEAYDDGRNSQRVADIMDRLLDLQRTR